MRHVPELRYLNTWSPLGNTVWGRSGCHSSAGESSLLGCWGWCQALREKLCAVSSLLSLPHAFSSRRAFSLPSPASRWLLCHQSTIPWNHEPKLILAPLVVLAMVLYDRNRKAAQRASKTQYEHPCQIHGCFLKTAEPRGKDATVVRWDARDSGNVNQTAINTGRKSSLLYSTPSCWHTSLYFT